MNQGYVLPRLDVHMISKTDRFLILRNFLQYPSQECFLQHPSCKIASAAFFANYRATMKIPIVHRLLSVMLGFRLDNNNSDDMKKTMHDKKKKKKTEAHQKQMTTK